MNPQQTYHAACPSCMSESEFIFMGYQKWPAAVAQRLGIPQTVSAWTCSNCHTTLLEPTLKPAINSATSSK